MKSTPNELPDISDIYITPDNPTSKDPVYVSALVIDPDGSLTSVTLSWGMNENDLSNNSGMIYNGSRYVAAIPAEEGGAEIFYRISATDNSGDSGSSGIFNFLIGSVGMTQPEQAGSISVYPIPADGRIFIFGRKYIFGNTSEYHRKRTENGYRGVRQWIFTPYIRDITC